MKVLFTLALAVLCVSFGGAYPHKKQTEKEAPISFDDFLKCFNEVEMLRDVYDCILGSLKPGPPQGTEDAPETPNKTGSVPTCGKQRDSAKRSAEINLAGRIVNGTEVNPGDIPWIGSLTLDAEDLGYPKQTFCGATIYDSTTMITAAHCIHEFPTNDAKNIKVVVAEHDTEGNEGREQYIAVEKIIEHENYDAGRTKSDIALLKLATPIDFGKEHVVPVCLPESCDLEPNAVCQLAGWGRTVEGGEGSSKLLRASSNILTDDECKEAYGSQVDMNVEVCAMKAGIDTCQGDSGGPMTVADSNGAHRLVGVVSWGYGCARPGNPGVYTKVCNFVDWIKQKAA